MTSPVSHTEAAAPSRQLSLFDTICIIVGIIIGAGIYETSPLIAANVSSGGGLLAVWLVGGLIALIGSLCYAELATTYPRDGGDYVFLSMAFGTRVGFLFAWAEYWIIRPGNVGMMAFVFARFAHELLPLVGHRQTGFLLYACVAIVILTALNLLGVKSGKTTQNVLTVVKVLGMVIIFIVGMWVIPARNVVVPAAIAEGSPDYRLALILVLFTYGGWNEMSYVAAEVRNPNRNILRSLLIGTVAVVLIYVAMNWVFLRTLGLDGTQGSAAVAADVMRIPFGESGGRVISLLVCLSCLGSINGMLFTGSRVFFAAGEDHRMIHWLGKWNARFDTPLRALVVQLLVTLVLVIGFGWYEQGFERLLYFTTPVFWSFATLVALSVIILRRKDPDTPRPHKAFLYPLTPILFCASSVFLVHASLLYALENQTVESLWTFGILGLGILFSFLGNASTASDTSS